MGLFDKIKNALFEEEYVEIEEKPKKPKKDILKNKDNNKPIAKKIVLPEKREYKIEELDDTELLDEDFEISPKSIEIDDDNKKDFKIMEDDDFKVEEEVSFSPSEPQIVKVIDNTETEREEQYYQKKKEKMPYGLDESNVVNVPDYGRSYDIPTQYGAYERKEERTHFKPSPIISPIYGILDKNYKKEDVVTKREVRLTSAYARENLSVDDVRKKAYGSLSDDIAKEIDIPRKEEEVSFEIEEKEENLFVDLSIEDEKPAVKEVTVGDALEYFQDLGLEYNVDYVDASKDKSVGRRSRDNYDEELNKVETKDNEVVSADTKDVDVDSDDNLFDLIDSMYKEND